MRRVHTIVEELLQAIRGADTKVISALRAHLLVLFNAFAPDDLAARVALLPQAFGAYNALAILRTTTLERWLLSREPGHGNQPLK
jgi:hypothetical protein